MTRVGPANLFLLAARFQHMANSAFIILASRSDIDHDLTSQRSVLGKRRIRPRSTCSFRPMTPRPPVRAMAPSSGHLDASIGLAHRQPLGRERDLEHQGPLLGLHSGPAALYQQAFRDRRGAPRRTRHPPGLLLTSDGFSGDFYDPELCGDAAFLVAQDRAPDDSDSVWHGRRHRDRSSWRDDHFARND